jgi:hypothetical protein
MAETFTDLFEGVNALPVESFIGSKDAFCQSWSNSSN